MPYDPKKPKTTDGKFRPRGRRAKLFRLYSITLDHQSTAAVVVRHCCPKRCEVEVNLSTMGTLPSAEGMAIVRHWLAGILVGPDTMGPASNFLRLRNHDAGVEHVIALRTEP